MNSVNYEGSFIGANVNEGSYKSFGIKDGFYLDE